VSASGAKPGRDPIARWILLLALAIGLVRFLRLARWSLWFDEAVTWTDYHHSLENAELGSTLGYRAIGATVGLLGGIPDEFALRFLPALCGWLAIPLTYWAFRTLAGNRRAAAAALLVAVSAWHVYWSQNARFYTMAQAVSLLGAGLVVRGLWSRRLVLSGLGFLVAALAVAFHPSGALVLPALVLAPFVLRFFRRLAPVPDPMPDHRAGAICLLLLAVFLLLRLGWAWSTLQTYIWQKPQSSPAHFLLTTGYYVTPILATGAMVGSVAAFRRRDPFHIFAALVVVIVVASALFLSLYARISAQYVFVALPWIALLAVVPLEAPTLAGTEPGPAPARALRVGWLALLVLPSLATTILYFTVRQGERPQWRDAYEYVWNHREEGDLVLGMEATVGEYYLNPARTELRHTVRVAWLDRYRAKEPARWADHARRTWYLLNPEQLLDWDADDAAAMRRFLAEECRLVACYPLYVESRDLSVWVYLRG
jgi:mannosyltransferase